MAEAAHCCVSVGKRLSAELDFAPTSLQRKGTSVGWKEMLHTETSGLVPVVGGGIDMISLVFTTTLPCTRHYSHFAKEKKAQEGEVSYTNW